MSRASVSVTQAAFTSTTADNPLIDLELELASPAPEMVVFLDPNLIELGAMPNRGATSFRGKQADDLEGSIRAIGYNVQPVGVRKVVREEGTVFYVLVFGERRVRACAAIGVLVRAIILPDESPLDDALQRLSENTNRKDLAPLELGRQVKYILDSTPGLTKTELARRLDFSLGHISKAYDLASLPAQILDAFPAQEELRFDQMLPLRQAFEKKPELVAAEVERIRAEAQAPNTKDIFERLVKAADEGSSAEAQDGLASGKGSDKKVARRPIQCGERPIGNWHLAADRKVMIEIAEPMSQKQLEALLTTMADYVGRRVFGLPSAKGKGKKNASADAASDAGLASCKPGEEGA